MWAVRLSARNLAPLVIKILKQEWILSDGRLTVLQRDTGEEGGCLYRGTNPSNIPNYKDPRQVPRDK